MPALPHGLCDPGDPPTKTKYQLLILEVANRERFSILVELDDVQLHENDEQFVARCVALRLGAFCVSTRLSSRKNGSRKGAAGRRLQRHQKAPLLKRT